MRQLITLIFILFTALDPDFAEAQEVSIPKKSIRSTKQATFHVLAIGVDKTDDPFWPALKYPKSDAAKVIYSLSKESDVKATLIANQDATFANVLSALKNIRSQVGPKDTVLVYFSGHGSLAQVESYDLEQVFIMRDTKSSAVEKTGLTMSIMKAWLEDLPAQRKALVLASCHSGVGKSKFPAHVAELLASQKGSVKPIEFASEGSLILAASAKGETAREDDKLGGDVYTSFFLDALNIYDRNKDGSVSILEAHDYAKIRTYEFSGGRQRPTLEAKVIGDADFTLRGKKGRAKNPILEAYDNRYDGLALKVGEQGLKGSIPMAFPLQEGLNYIQVFVGNADVPQATYKVDVDENEQISIDDLFKPHPFRVGLGLTYVNWMENRTRELYGRNNTIDFTLLADYIYEPLLFEFTIGPGKRAETELRPGIDVTTEYLTYSFRSAYYRRLGTNVAIYGGLGIADANVTVKVKDKKTNQEEEREKSKFIPLVFLGSEYFVRDRYIIFGNLEYQKATLDFEDWGSVRTDYLSITAGIKVGFGRKADRI